MTDFQSTTKNVDLLNRKRKIQCGRRLALARATKLDKFVMVC